MARKCYFVIPAGGNGSRFGTKLPKQFVSILGKPLILYTLEAVIPFAEHCVLAISESYFPLVSDLIRPFHWGGKCHLILSGETRFHSVRNALEGIPEGELVAIHDAARPLISSNTVTLLLNLAISYKAAIPYKPLNDSIRQLSRKGNLQESSRPVDRSHFVSIQTPQVFHSELIKEAYKLPYQERFSDDSSVYEACFHVSPILVEDLYPNFKITHPEDRLVFEALLQKANK